jgi:hypothetical protein
MSDRKVPSLRHHKARGLAVVTLGGKDFYCGRSYLNSDHHHSMRITKTGYLKWQDLFDVTREGNTGHIRPKPDADDRVSEIIAFASRGAGPIPRQLPIVVPGWMKSPGHRAVIVKTCWKEIWAAFAFAKDGSTYYCVTFGNRPTK